MGRYDYKYSAAERFWDFVEEHWIEAMMISMVVGVLWVTWLAASKKNEKEKLACARMMALAKTPKDSIEVIQWCEVKDRSGEIIPVYIPR